MVSLVSGLLVAVEYRWASSWGAVILAPYVSSLLRGDPVIDLASQMPFPAQLHVLASFATLAVIPFTRVATFLVAAIHGCLTVVSRVTTAAISATQTWIRK